jgi:hypothetical protein
LAYFYHLLPIDTAVHFEPDGTPDRWLTPPMTTVLALLPQFFLSLVAVALAWLMTRVVSRFWQPGETKGNLETIISVMGNMLALPQIVFAFAMADIFVYNAYQVRLPPLWIFALIVMVLGGVIIGVFFIRAIRRELKTRR